MDENLSSMKRRWHDNRGKLSESIDLLEFIPEAILPLIAEGLTNKAEKDFEAGIILRSLHSLGKEKIMALHQAQKKQRSYDKNPNTHRILNCFFVLPEKDQDALATEFLSFVTLIVDYLATCDSFGIQPKEEELQQMRARFVDSGATAVQQYLLEIHQDYNMQIVAEPDPAAGDKDETLLIESEKGMRLKDI